ncbi:MAG: P-II family nitrogen regulator [Clostridiales bacterium]|nr:P-II family nitrogen regulator [Clostridiales bacterium]
MDSLNKGLVLFWCIMDFGRGTKLFRLYKEAGGKGGTIILGRGTVKSELLKILGITDTRKEIFFTVIDQELEDAFYEKVINKFHLDKPHHGIAFSMPVKYCSSIDESTKSISSSKGKGVNKLGYEAIFVIVNKGAMDDVLEAAESAGSTGGTIIHGRGSGAKEKETLFNIEIEPEKDIVLILSKAEKTQAIVDAIKERLDIEKPGAGIIFVMDVSRTVGLYEEKK